MSDYFTARKKRYEKVIANMHELAKKLTTLGCTVTHEPTASFSYMLIRKDGKHCNFGFDEVPYRWYIDVSHTPNKETGSGSRAWTAYSISPDDIPNAELVMSFMKPEYSGFEKDHRVSLISF